MVETGALRPDDHQTKIIQILQDLYNKLLEYSPPSLPIVAETKSLVKLPRSALSWSCIDFYIPSSHGCSLALQNLKRKRKVLVAYTFMETLEPGRLC